jgi:hypothetical protein
MLTYLPEIVIDDLAAPASKRRRLNYPHAEGVAIESARNASDCVSSARTTPTPSICATVEEICENTLVCYGMISDLKVHRSLHHVASSISTQHAIRFEPPRTLHYGIVDTPAGRLDDYGGELLQRLVADDELILQFVLSSAAIAPTTEKKLLKDSLQYLGVTIYGPRRRFSDVGDFMTQAGCYLDDPVGCDRNVPYMNPQCLFSLHEPPPMTFDLLQQLQHPEVDNFSRASLDVLSGFETTDDFELSANPTALRTELKVHQRQALTFFLRRERGMHPNKDGFGVWLRKTSDEQTTCVFLGIFSILVYGP